MVGSGETLLAGTMVQQKVDPGTEDLIRMFRGDDLHPLFASPDSQKRFIRRWKSGALKVWNIQGKCAPEVIEVGSTRSTTLLFFRARNHANRVACSRDGTRIAFGNNALCIPLCIPGKPGSDAQVRVAGSAGPWGMN